MKGKELPPIHGMAVTVSEFFHDQGKGRGYGQLRSVARGNRVTITYHGKPYVTMFPGKRLAKAEKVFNGMTYEDASAALAGFFSRKCPGNKKKRPITLHDFILFLAQRHKT